MMEFQGEKAHINRYEKSIRPKWLCELAAFRGREIGYDDPRPLLYEPFHGGLSQSTRSAGHQRDEILKEGIKNYCHCKDRRWAHLTFNAAIYAEKCPYTASIVDKKKPCSSKYYFQTLLYKRNKELTN